MTSAAPGAGRVRRRRLGRARTSRRTGTGSSAFHLLVTRPRPGHPPDGRGRDRGARRLGRRRGTPVAGRPSLSGSSTGRPATAGSLENVGDGRPRDVRRSRRPGTVELLPRRAGEEPTPPSIRPPRASGDRAAPSERLGASSTPTGASTGRSRRFSGRPSPTGGARRAARRSRDAAERLAPRRERPGRRDEDREDERLRDGGR